MQKKKWDANARVLRDIFVVSEPILDISLLFYYKEHIKSSIKEGIFMTEYLFFYEINNCKSMDSFIITS